MLDRWVVPLAAVFDGTQFDARRNNNNKVVPDVNRVAAHHYGLLRNIVQYQLYGVLVRVPGMLQVAQQLIIPLLTLEFPLPGFKSLTDMLATSLRLDPDFPQRYQVLSPRVLKAVEVGRVAHTLQSPLRRSQLAFGFS